MKENADSLTTGRIVDARALGRFMDIGTLMLEGGAEVRRVEDTIQRLCRAYGAARADVFAITATLGCTMTMPDGSVCSIYRNTEEIETIDFGKLERINAVSRSYCSGTYGNCLPDDEIRSLRSGRISGIRMYGGSMLAAGALCVFFGGSSADGLAAVAFAVCVCALQLYFAPICANAVLFNFVSSFVTGLAVCLAGYVLPIHVDKVMIGDIMLLIPGLSLANAVSDMFVGDIITGALSVLTSVMLGAAIASGFALSVLCAGV